MILKKKLKGVNIYSFHIILFNYISTLNLFVEPYCMVTILLIHIQDPNWHQIDERGLQPPQESWEHLHIPQDLPSQWTPGLLLFGVETGGPFIFLSMREREKEKDRERKRLEIERKR